MPEYKFDSVVAFLNTLYSFIYIADFEGGLNLINTIRWNRLLPRMDVEYMATKLRNAETIYKAWFKNKDESIKEWQKYLNEEAKPF